MTGGAPVRFNKSSSDDRPGPGICSCKYVEDVKAARSVRVWDRVPIKKQWEGGKPSQAQPPVLAPPSTFLSPLLCSIYSSDKYSEIVAVTAEAPVLFNKSSSNDRPGPGICSCKYVEDAKAARSVRVWDRVPIKKQSRAWSSQVLLRVTTPTILCPFIQAITSIHCGSVSL